MSDLPLPSHVRPVLCAWCGQLTLDPLDLGDLGLVCLPCVQDVTEQ